MRDISYEIEHWKGLQAGDEAALQALYMHCYNDLLRYGIQLTHDHNLTKELINRLFANLWQKKDLLPLALNPKAYIVASFRNLVLFRKENKAVQMLHYPGDMSLLEESHDKVSQEETRIQLDEAENRKTRIAHALSFLSARQKTLIVSRFIEEKTYEEIAAEFDISVRTVYNSIHESLKTLRNNLNKEDFI